MREEYRPCSTCGKLVEYKRYMKKEKNIFCSDECLSTHRKAMYKNPVFRVRHSRSTREAMSRADVQSKIRKPRIPMSFERRKKQSDVLVGKRPKNITGFMRSFGHYSKQGEIDFGPGRKFFMRSTWERNIARYYEHLRILKEIKEWEYEPQRFFFEGVAFGHRTYLPDFRITENDGRQYYVEVKGFMDDGSKTKLKRMLKYFPGIEIQVIDKERYFAISKIAPALLGWEYDQTSKRAQYHVKKGWL